MTPIALLTPSEKPDVRTEVAREELFRLVARLAPNEGANTTAYPGLLFHRISKPSPFEKWNTFGPRLIIVVQGAKVSLHRGVKLHYDPSRYLVVTGEAEFEGMVTEASPQRPYFALCFGIPADLVAKTLLSIPLSANEPLPSGPMVEPVPAFISPMEPTIAECVVRLVRAIDDPLERAIVAPLAAEELVFRLLRTDAAAAIRSAVQSERDAEKIRSAMRYLRGHLGEPVAVEDIARHVAMSPSHFAHRFRAVARMSPMRYLKELRMGHARSLLLASGIRVSEAATRAGYESPSHFTRDFKAFYGSSPAEYVRRFAESDGTIAGSAVARTGLDS